MIESPLYQEIVAESEQKAHVEGILYLLQRKFGPVSPDITAGLALVKDKEKILRLLAEASNGASLQAFADALRKELPAPTPASTRGKRQKPST